MMHDDPIVFDLNRHSRGLHVTVMPVRCEDLYGGMRDNNATALPILLPVTICAVHSRKLRHPPQPIVVQYGAGARNRRIPWPQECACRSTVTAQKRAVDFTDTPRSETRIIRPSRVMGRSHCHAAQGTDCMHITDIICG
jgi:hypothetical protein